MFNDFFAKYSDYIITEKPSKQVIDNYKDKLPDELIEFWQEYGFGIYMNGYLKIVNPEIYQPILNEGYNTENNKEIVFAVTGLGDFIVWVGDAIRLVDFRHGKYAIVNSSNFGRFFEKRLGDDSFLKIEFKNENYLPAKVRLGALEFDECYGYVSLLGMGGSEKAENLQKVKIREYISIIAQILGKIE